MSRAGDAIRRYGWLAAAAAISAITVGAGLFALSEWQRAGWGTAERLTAITDTFAFAGLLDAAIAALVGVAAFYVATRLSDLTLSASINNSPQVDLPPADRKEKTPTVLPYTKPRGHEAISLYFVLKNRSRYSARNPAMRVLLD